jgi:glucose-1-phosphate thymidylyltransferase
MRPVIGILPAAGLGSRLHPFAYPKELLPIGYRWSAEHQEVAPSLVIEHSLDAMAIAGITRCLLIVSPNKSEVVRVLGAGSARGPRLAYVVQPEPAGLAGAVLQALPFVSDLDCNACLALPDTLFRPIGALEQVTRELEATGADLVLGVFPTTTPEQLGPVGIRTDGTVEFVLEKPAVSPCRNTWGVAAWTPRFFQLLDEESKRSSDDHLLQRVFDRACRTSGLSVRAVEFPSGSYLDLGTRRGIVQALAQQRRQSRQSRSAHRRSTEQPVT